MAPIFVGSNDDNSRVRSDRVGFAISTSNPGSASEGDAYYNSSDSQLNIYDGSAWASAGAGGNSSELTASGSLSDGQSVIIQSDGKVSGISTVGLGTTAGSIITVESASTDNYGIMFCSGVNRVVLTYRDNGNAYRGTVIVGTVDPSDNSISFGTAQVFEDAQINFSAPVWDSDLQRLVIAYNDEGNSRYGTAIVGTINASDNSISFGTAAVFESARSDYINATEVGNSKVVISYQDDGNSSYGTAVVGTINATNNSISFGTPIVYNSSNTEQPVVTYDSGADKVLFTYQDSGNSNYGTCRVGTVSGTTISLGTAVAFENATTSNISAAYMPTINKTIIAYKDGSADRGLARAATISGTTPSYGNIGQYSLGSNTVVETTVAFDSDTHRAFITYEDDSDNDAIKTVPVVITGDNLTFGPTINIYGGDGDIAESTYDSNARRIVTMYRDNDDSDYLKAMVLRPEQTNLTSTNFLGFSDAAYSDGQTAKIQIAGSVDDAQSGLTTAKKHYVQNDGTLSTTADNPSVEAGVGISTTQIIVLG